MEGGLTLLAWSVMAILLVSAAGTLLAYDRLRGRLDVEKQGRAGIERIVEQANDGIIVLDFVSGRIHHANPSAAEMLGLSMEALHSMTVFDLHREMHTRGG